MSIKIITINKKASFEYHLTDKYEAGIILKAGEIKKQEEKKSEEDNLSKKIDYGKLSIIQLEKAISVAVKNEDYELAAHLRDEINKRK